MELGNAQGFRIAIIFPKVMSQEVPVNETFKKKSQDAAQVGKRHPWDSLGLRDAACLKASTGLLDVMWLR